MIMGMNYFGSKKIIFAISIYQHWNYVWAEAIDEFYWSPTPVKGNIGTAEE